MLKSMITNQANVKKEKKKNQYPDTKLKFSIKNDRKSSTTLFDTCALKEKLIRTQLSSSLPSVALNVKLIITRTTLIVFQPLKILINRWPYCKQEINRCDSK